MSLTNPKNVVTEERLSEFYQQILPYLGGMPEALANKFSKSDLYSTDEKIVGCWTDGKPIYQKTILSTTNSASPSDKYVNIGASIDKVVDLNGILESAGYFVKLPWYTFSGGTLILNFITALNNSASSNKNTVRVYVENPNYVNKPVYIVIRYTKTTDAANSFKYGSETDYSTDEKIVGTWIDGKPMYQKTVIKEVPAGSDVQLPVRTEISSMDSFIKYEVCGIMNHPTNKAYVNPNASENQDDYGFKFEDNMHGSTITAGNERILTLKNTNTVHPATAYVTMMYTKTTD